MLLFGGLVLEIQFDRVYVYSIELLKMKMMKMLMLRIMVKHFEIGDVLFYGTFVVYTMDVLGYNLRRSICKEGLMRELSYNLPSNCNVVRIVVENLKCL